MRVRKEFISATEKAFNEGIKAALDVLKNMKTPLDKFNPYRTEILKRITALLDKNAHN